MNLKWHWLKEGKMAIDFKKTEKDLYQPKPTPTIIDVPELVFLAVHGKGDTRRHHEIYLSDQRKVAPDKLKTVIRSPIRFLE